MLAVLWGVVVLSIFVIAALIIIIVIGYKYIKFLSYQHLTIVENLENIRNLFMEYEKDLYDFTRNPVVQTEMNYKRIQKNINSARRLFSEFEDFYKDLPGKIETEDE